MTLSDWIQLLDGRKSGKGWKAKCPAHEDKVASLSILEGKEGAVLLKCFAGCSLDAILSAVGKTKRDLFAKEMFATQSQPREEAKPAPPFNWQPLVDAFTDKDAEKVARWRGFTPEFVRELREAGWIGIYNDHGARRLAFPVQGADKITCAHYRVPPKNNNGKAHWFYKPTGNAATPWVIGKLIQGERVIITESTFDGLAWMEKSGERDGIIIARGAANGVQAAALIPKGSIAYVLTQNDEPGANFEKVLVENTPEEVRRIRTPAPHKDLNNWTKSGALSDDLLGALVNAETLREASAATSESGEKQTRADDETIKRLAALPTLEYERQRKEAAKKLGCRDSVLDDLVNAKRLLANPASDSLQGIAVHLPEIELWPEPVNGALILDAISTRFSYYVVMPQGAGDMLTLWCAHTHTYKVFQITPRANIISPTPECGKTTLRDCAALFCARSMPADNMTTAVMFRLVTGHSPTLLCDECDKWLYLNEDLVGLLCSGHRKGGFTMRCEGDSNELRRFDCFAPVLLAAIGALPDQLHSRSISVRLERATQQEIAACARFNFLHVEYENELCRKLARWIADHTEEIAACDPKLPEHLYNRIGDNWRPLFAIAEIAGGDWPHRCTQALIKLTTREDETDSLRVMLLADIRQVFTADRMFSKDLVDALVALKERPWGEIRRGGKPITERWLAKNLAAFRIQPKLIRIDDDRPARGYKRSDFDETYKRYLGDRVSDPLHRYNTYENGDFRSVTKHEVVTDTKPIENLDKSQNDKSLFDSCNAVTDPEPHTPPNDDVL
jgi:putative DNA primase/helicase